MNNEEFNESLRRGIEQAARGETVDLGDFSQYLPTTLEQWAERIRALIKEAEAAGFDVWIDNPCCGCSNMDLVITAESSEDAEQIWPEPLPEHEFRGKIHSGAEQDCKRPECNDPFKESK